MEVVSLNLDDLEVAQERIIGEMAIRQYRFPQVPAGTYRVFFMDETYQDVQAENASHAFQLTGRSDITKLINLKFAYSHILEKDVIHATGEEVKPSLEGFDDTCPALLAEVSTPDAEPFQRMDLGTFATLAKAARE